MAKINQNCFKISGLILDSPNVGLEKVLVISRLFWKVMPEEILREWAKQEGGKPRKCICMSQLAFNPTRCLLRNLVEYI